MFTDNKENFAATPTKSVNACSVFLRAAAVRLFSEQSLSITRTTISYSLLALVTLLAPLGLWRWSGPFIRLMDAVYHPIPLLQLFVFCATLALTGVGGYAFWQDRRATLQQQLPLVMALLVFFHILSLMRHHAARSWDYGCYEGAAQALVQGLNPYGDCYLYLPTMAQALAWLYTASAGGMALVSTDLTSKAAQRWDLLFYFYEAIQFFQVILAYVLCYRFARRLGLAANYAGILVASLFLFNNPLQATLKHNQLNLWVLNSLLVALLWLPRAPLWSGIAVAIGGHLKLYPLMLLLPWTMTRQWRALLGATVGGLGIVLLQTKGGVEWQIWRAFLDFAAAFPKGTFFRDNSLHSLVYNSLGHWQWLQGDSSYTVNEQRVNMLVFALMGLCGLVYWRRFWQREQCYQHGAQQAEQAQQELIQLGHMMDAIALGLLLSPIVWEHHYLLALPLVIWAMANQRTVEQLWRVALSAFLIFVIPTFDFFPLSYHRLAGLLLLLGTLPPMPILQWAGLQTRFHLALPAPATANRSGSEG